MRNINHLLVIRTSAMGDVAMAVPVLLALHQTYPELKITLLTNDFFAPMFSQIPNLKVKHWDTKGKHKGLLGSKRLYQELRQLHIDAIADIHNVLRTHILKSFFLVSRIPFISIDKGRAEKKALTAWKPKSIYPLKTSHFRYVEVFDKLGLPISFNEDVFFLKKEKLSNKCHQLIGADIKKWIGIAPFAAHQGKVYSWIKMTEVIKELNAIGDCTILLFGGGSKEEKLLNDLSSKLDHVISVVGKIPFSEELSLMSNLDIMVSMDSGNGHLAAMYGISVITIWGVTHPYLGYAPYKQPLENCLIPDLNLFPLVPTSVYGNKSPKEYENVINNITKKDILCKIINSIS